MNHTLHRYGPWAVVTGASDGIGRAAATQLAAAGVSVVLVARREAALTALADALSREHRVQTKVIAADLGKPAGVAAVVAGTEALDVGLLVAAAGFGTHGAFVDAPLDVELDMIAVNCVAVAALAHPFAARFAARKRGGLLLFSSVVAFQGAPHAANYAATKAYVQSLAEGLRAELAPRGVDVLAAAPGPVHTGFAARAGMVMGAAARPDDVARASLAALPRGGTVRPGGLAKLLGGSLSLLPRALRVWLMGRIMGGMAPSA